MALLFPVCVFDCWFSMIMLVITCMLFCCFIMHDKWPLVYPSCLGFYQYFDLPFCCGVWRCGDGGGGLGGGWGRSIFESIKLLWSLKVQLRKKSYKQNKPWSDNMGVFLVWELWQQFVCLFVCLFWGEGLSISVLMAVTISRSAKS